MGNGAFEGAVDMNGVDHFEEEVESDEGVGAGLMGSAYPSDLGKRILLHQTTQRGD